MWPPLETSNARKEILEYWPEISNPHVRRILAKVEMLQNLLLKIKKGGATRIDWFKAAKILLSMSRKELIYLLLSLGQTEFPSIFPYTLRFIKRKPTEYDRQRERRLTSAANKEKKIRNEDNIVALVAKRRNETRASIESIINDLSLSKRPVEISSSSKQKRLSESLIWKYYNAGIKRAQKRGFATLQPPNHMIPPDLVPMEPSRKGRPRKTTKNRT